MMRNLIIKITITAATVAVLAACGTGNAALPADDPTTPAPKMTIKDTPKPTEPETIDVDGFYTIAGTVTGTRCEPEKGYSGVEKGDNVIIQNDAGFDLGAGKVEAPYQMDGDCVYHFMIKDVPTDEDRYGVTIGANVLAMSLDELKDGIFIEPRN